MKRKIIYSIASTLLIYLAIYLMIRWVYRHQIHRHMVAYEVITYIESRSVGQTVMVAFYPLIWADFIINKRCYLAGNDNLIGVPVGYLTGDWIHPVKGQPVIPNGMER